jgi:predicted phage tail protein
MRLNVVFTVAAISMVILGLAQLLAPAAMLAAAYSEVTPSTGFLMNICCAGCLATINHFSQTDSIGS